MNLTETLRLLEKAGVEIQEEKTDKETGIRTIVLGAALPMVDTGGRVLYTTLVVEPGQDDFSVEERDALKRRLGHLCTNIFGDDVDFEGLEGSDEDEEENGSHLHTLIAKKSQS